MNYYIVFSLAVWFFPLPVLSVFSVATEFLSLQTEVPLARCDGFGLCEKDDGGVVFGETMEAHLLLPTVWIDPMEANHHSAPFKIGDIIVFDEQDLPVLRSGILDTMVYRWRERMSRRQIMVNTGGRDTRRVGYLIVDVPSSSPDTIFESFA